MISASEFYQKIKSYNPSANEALLKSAYAFSKSEHGNQKRHSGDPYFSHPLAVAEILIELKMDQDSIIAALLHDIVEDTDITLDEIENKFGETVASLVDGVTKLGKIDPSSIKSEMAENFRKLTLAMSRDIRVLLIKLADRLHNMRTLYYMPSKERRIKKAKESLEIYAPLAARIGLNKIKDEIQERAFEIIDPENHEYIVKKLNSLIQEKQTFIDKVLRNLRSLLRSEKIKFKVEGRQKTPYSIFKKMKFKNVGFHHLYDIMAFRIIVDDIEKCYRVLGVINSTYNMIPGTFRDYISTPKDNGYRSIHLAILGPFNKKIEIQIRDKRMHEEAELGLAAHWNYKDSQSKKGKKSNSTNEFEAKQYQWVRDLISLFEHSQNADEALEQNNLLLHKDEVFCFTPNGDIFNLPLGATAIDFAYAVHSEVGNSCASTKINGVIAPLRQKLENGDQVEVITSKNAKPSANWLQFASTAKARAAVRSFLRQEKFEEHKRLGYGILNKFFASRNKRLREEMLEKILPDYNFKSLDQLYIQTAEGKISRREILHKIYPETDIYEENEAKELSFELGTKNKDDALPIDGLVSGMAVRFAGCCNPIPGDNIVGVINTGTGVTIHNQNCSNLKNMVIRPQRIIDVRWKNKNKTGKYLYSTRISGVILNKAGALANVTSILAKQKVNILNLSVVNRNDDFFSLVIDIEVRNNEQVESALSALSLSKNINDVKRA